ncbi:MAG: hypothetical protein Tsb0020_40530 [Haliangiales bacterium]
MKLTYPNMRAELVEHLADLSDPDKIEHGGPTGSLLDYAVNFLFDDTVLAEDAKQAVGWFLRDEAEAAAVQAITDALNRVFDVHGTDKSDAEYTRCAEWGAVAASAQAAHRLLVRADEQA